jgi:hypothetical protein
VLDGVLLALAVLPALAVAPASVEPASVAPASVAPTLSAALLAAAVPAPPAWLPWGLLLAGGLLVVAAFGRRRRRARRHASWGRTTGEVVDEVRAGSAPRQASPSYAPVVRFQTSAGEDIEGEPRAWTWVGISRIGRTAEVAYDPERPERFDAWYGTDRTGLPLGLAGVAVMLVGMLLLP